MNNIKRSNEDLAAVASMVAPTDVRQTVLATAVPDPLARRMALVVIVLAVVACTVMTPFANVHLSRLPAFIPSYESALALIDFVSAAMLWSQFTILRRRSLLAVASAYFLSSLLAAAHAASFPSGPDHIGLFGDGQTTAWLYVFWHASFPACLLYYALVADTGRDVLPARASTRRVGIAAVAIVVAIASAFVALATFGTELMPTLIVNGDYRRLTTTGITPGILALCVVLTGFLWSRRTRSVLDLWLFVVAWVWMCDVTLSAVISSARYDLGWYGGRLFGLLSASLVLTALLFEVNLLYARLASATREAALRNEDLDRSRDALARTQRFEAFGQLTGGMAHDFNNLLTAITGSLEMIGRRPTDSDRVQRLAATAMRAADRGTQLIRRLMSFARKQNLRPEFLDTNATLREFAALAANLPASSATLRLSPGEDTGLIHVDEAEFQAAFFNLLTNSRDAMPDGGEIVISTRAVHLYAGDLTEADMTPGDYVQIAIVDHGVGMSPDVRAHAFEPFFSTKPRDLGSGLGLSQVYGFVRSAYGQIDIDSEIDVGTTIRMYLPRASEEAAHDDRFDRPTITANTVSRSVLLVDDDRDVLEATKDRVEELGYLVITARSGDEAFELLKKGLVVDVVLSDIVMAGGLNGVQLAEAVRRIRPAQKLVLTSGYTGGALDQFQLPRGLVFLAKPYSQQDLAEKLQAAAVT